MHFQKCHWRKCTFPLKTLQYFFSASKSLVVICNEIIPSSCPWIYGIMFVQTEPWANLWPDSESNILRVLSFPLARCRPSLPLDCGWLVSSSLLHTSLWFFFFLILHCPRLFVFFSFFFFFLNLNFLGTLIYCPYLVQLIYFFPLYVWWRFNSPQVMPFGASASPLVTWSTTHR